MSHSHSDQPDFPRPPDTATGQRRQISNSSSGAIPRFKVVLHQDDNDLMFVVRSVMELTRFPRAEATHKMWEAVHRGRSVLLTTYYERAELFVQLFTSRGLKVTAEPA